MVLTHLVCCLNTHCRLAVVQLTQRGRFSSHCHINLNILASTHGLAQLLRTLTCRLLHSTQPVLDFVWGFRGIMALGALFSRVESRRSEGLCSDLINQGLGGQGYVAGKTRGSTGGKSAIARYMIECDVRLGLIFAPQCARGYRYVCHCHRKRVQTICLGRAES